MSISISEPMRVALDALYEGKPVGVWVQQLKEDRIEKREQALRAIVALRGTAIPALVRALRTRDSRFKQWIFHASRQIPFLRGDRCKAKTIPDVFRPAPPVNCPDEIHACREPGQ